MLQRQWCVSWTSGKKRVIQLMYHLMWLRIGLSPYFSHDSDGLYNFDHNAESTLEYGTGMELSEWTPFWQCEVSLHSKNPIPSTKMTRHICLFILFICFHRKHFKPNNLAIDLKSLKLSKTIYFTPLKRSDLHKSYNQLTSSMAYGTRRFYAAFTWALQ